MVPFTFALADGVELRDNNGKYSLVSSKPIRFIFLGKNLYQVVKAVISGTILEQLLKNESLEKRKQMVNDIFTLVTKGYLKLKVNIDYKIKNSEAPFISIIIPVKNRPDDIKDCLSSLMELDYFREKMEIIVVDDGSNDETAKRAKEFGVTVISNDKSKGPAFSRNEGAKIAQGEILAFVDSDCIASANWLQEIIPFFSLDGLAAIGGFVESYFRTTLVDRYEEAFSSLNMGSRIIFEADTNSNFYVPSCNFFIKKDVFREVGGFKPGMHLGEDVDLTWRIRDNGYALMYLPFGSVQHKHRNILRKMLKRRFEYGTSESDLYLNHPKKEKKFPVPLFAGLSGISILLSILLAFPWILLLNVFFFLGDFIKKREIIKQLGRNMPCLLVALASLRSFGSFYYYLSFHLIRYYLLLMILGGFFIPNIYLLLICVLLIASSVDYNLKKPRMNYPFFLLIYILEHGFYQGGVIAGCFKYRFFRCYIPRFIIK